MKLERYAVVLAHLDYFRSTDAYEVLRALHVDPGIWYEVDEARTAEFALAAKRHETRRALLFTSVFHRTRRALLKTQPSLETVAAQCARIEAVRAAALPAIPAARDELATELAAAAETPARAQPVVVREHMSSWAPPAERSTSRSTTPEVHHAPYVEDAALSVDETMTMAALVDDDPLPFAHGVGHGAVAPPHAADGVAADAAAMAGETSFLPALRDSDFPQSLPFPKKTK